MKILKKFLLIFICSLVVVSAVGCGSNTDQTTSDENTQDVNEDLDNNENGYDMTDVITIGNMEIAISYASEETSIGEDNQFTNEAKTRGKFVVITMNITNIGDREITIDSSEFNLLSDGKVYSPSVDPGVVEAFGGSFLFMKSINPGMDSMGMIAFEVPTDLQNYKLVISPVGLDESAYINIDTES